jgi:hypothetical protein
MTAVLSSPHVLEIITRMTAALSIIGNQRSGFALDQFREEGELHPGTL